jgi:GNAT acetyltransferase-like protein
MSWEFQPAVEAFEEVRKDWDALNRAQHNHILLDSRFVAPLLRHFESPGVLLGVNDDPRKRGMALVQRKSPGVWETYQPSQAPLGLILCGSTANSSDELISLLRSLPGYAIQLSVLHQDPDYSPFQAVNGDGRLEKLDYIRTARIPLAGTFQEYWQAREPRVRKNNDRLRRRMEEKGLRVQFVALRDPAEVADAIREYGRLESKGWKAQEGTAVTPDNVQGQFYRELLEGFCARGEGVIYQLRVNGMVVASDLCLVRQGMLVLLKTAYDEEWSVYSPAFLLREDVVRTLYTEGKIRTYEFYGPLMDYQLRWTDQIRTLYHLTCFRHGWLRPLKGLVKRAHKT